MSGEMRIEVRRELTRTRRKSATPSRVDWPRNFLRQGSFVSGCGVANLIAEPQEQSCEFLNLSALISTRRRELVELCRSLLKLQACSHTTCPLHKAQLLPSDPAISAGDSILFMSSTLNPKVHSPATMCLVFPSWDIGEKVVNAVAMDT
jgi:hypothetical protein